MISGRALFVPFLLILAAMIPSLAAGAGDNIFAGTQVHTINIQFSQPAWWDSLTIYYNEGNEQYIPATVIADGVTYDSVGVRLKGNASYSHPNNKKPFRLSFDEYIGSQRWDGLKGVHLNNCWEDPTFIREKLHLDYCRAAGIPAPRGEFAELYLNGELWGFYSLVEHVDKLFLASRYGNNSGNLYKAVDGLLGSPTSDFKWYGSDPSLYYNRYEFKTDDSLDPWTDLIAVIDSLNNSPNTEAAVPPVVNMDGLYRAIATDLLMSSLDSYAGSCRNFYCYFNPATSKMEWIIWDAGMSFGSYWGAAQNYETLSITYVSSTANRPLVAKVFSTPALQAEYLDAFCELFTARFSEAQLFPQIDAIADVIRPYVYADPRKMYTNEQFEANIVSDITVGGHRKPGLKSFITARAANVQSQLTALGISCEGPEPGEIVINEFAADNTQILDPAGEAEDWIEMYNNTNQSVSLAGLYLSDDFANPTKWQFPSNAAIAANGYLIVWADDDAGQEGLHANFKLSASGERVMFSTQSAVLDSVTFGAQTTNMTMARIPNGTGPFIQGSPTFNGRNGLAIGDVVINEFAADNTLILDPAGDAEDWVELHNNTAHSIGLGGMYLSDDPSALTKWQFPAGTVIEAHGYLIVWADNEPTEQGLHATWKLSASGESVVFSDGQPSVLDAITFGVQTRNLTMARVPNGTGPFVQGAPTFNASNGSGNDIVAGEIVINEFMADNTLILDPSGEAEDWIEFYNTTGRTIDFSGLYLSDDLTAPTKWQFPSGTILAPDSYLIVWADEDLSQEGIHAGFKLSSGGESILFSNTDLTVLESETYGPQVTNNSMARIPNGTGPFELSPLPTPGAFNRGQAGVGEIRRSAMGLEQNVPNPFSRMTAITFTTPTRGHVDLRVFDLQGRTVATIVNRVLDPGTFRMSFDAKDLPSGVYLCRLRGPDVTSVKRLLVVR
jgi:hypothetical protein